jgi:hypothetical protein
MTDLENWLAELVSQQARRDDRISAQDLGRAWDAYLDSVLDARAQEQGVDPRSEAEVKALWLILGLLEEDPQESVDAMHRVLAELNGDDVVAVVLVLLQILMHQIGVDHGGREFDHVGVGEDDYAGLAELHDGDDVIDVLLIVLRILMHVIGAHREIWRSHIRTRLNVIPGLP